MSHYTRRFLLVLLLCSDYQAIPSSDSSPTDSNTSIEQIFVRKSQESNGAWKWCGGWCTSVQKFITSYLPSFLSGSKKEPDIRRCWCCKDGDPTTTTSDSALEVRSIGGKLGSGAVCFGYFWYNLGKGACKFVVYTTGAVGSLIKMECERLCRCAR